MAVRTIHTRLARAHVRVVLALALSAACGAGPSVAQLESDNPIPSSDPVPYGMEEFFADAPRPAAARVRLGRWLFFDKRLSADHTISCASCHRPEYAFSDVAPSSPGIKGRRGRRKTPSILNLANRSVPVGSPDPGPAFFWDGRATSLEMQVLVPIRDPAEMGLEHSAMVSRLAGTTGYAKYFSEAFESPGVTLDAVAAALADYVRARRSGNSPFDRWAFGLRPAEISVQAQQGQDVFFFKGRCRTCHAGDNFSDGLFHNLGVGWNPATRAFADEGRRAVTNREADTGRFKTPGLRDVEKHAPYMHDGSLRTLREVVGFYNRGGIPNPWQTARMQRPLDLTEEEIDALVTFLRTLSGEGYQDPGPRFFPQ